MLTYCSYAVEICPGRALRSTDSLTYTKAYETHNNLNFYEPVVFGFYCVCGHGFYGVGTESF